MKLIKNKNNRKIKLLQLTAVVLVILFLVSAILFFANLWESTHKTDFSQNTSDLLTDVDYNGESYKLKSNIETILVIGLDKFENETIDSYNNDKQADFIMLFVLDNKNSTCSAIHISRDTMAEINVLGVAGDKIGTVKKQLALSHTYGNGKEVSCRNTANAVSKLLMNVEINHYVSVSMDAVPIYNDIVGGVEVEVLDDFNGIDETLVKGETVRLMGNQALTYVRSRYGMDDATNNNRMLRQRQYIESLYASTVNAVDNNDNFVSETLSTLAESVVSDCSVNRLETIFNKIKSYDFTGISYISGETVLGDEYYEFYPAESSITENVLKHFYEQQE